MLAVTLLSGVVGCSRSTSVEGDITYDGQPIELGRIIFEPLDSSAVKRGGRFEKGHYKLEPPDNPPAGEHKVQIHWLKSTGQTRKNEFGEVQPVLEEGLPAKYHSKTTLTATVKPGHNVIDFQLEK